MGIGVSDVVVSLRGRDGGKTFMVIGMEDGCALVADGRSRRVEKPKRKKLKHLAPAAIGGGRASQKLRDGAGVTNGEIRKALAEAVTAEPGEKGGMPVGEGRRH